ncbi:MAG: amidohydrolase family protein [Candidatus Dormibacteria bacterium]
MLLVNGHVVDVVEGRVLRNCCVEVQGDRISKVGERWGSGGQEDTVDLRGAYLLPGLISVHTHLSVVYPFSATDASEHGGTSCLRALTRARDALNAGITTLRCVHEQNRADLILREAGKEGWVEVPTIVGAGRGISTTGGHGSGMATAYADGADEFRRAAREEFQAGADHVKIFITGGLADPEEALVQQMTVGEMSAVVDAAAAHNSYVVAHAGSSAAIRSALSVGVRSFEHAYELDAETAQLMSAAGAFLTPTLCVTRSPEWMSDHHFSQEQIRRALEVGPGHLESIRRAIRAGVTLVNGTDYPPGSAMDGTVVAVREAEFLVEAGLTPVEALRASSTSAAELIHRAGEVGRVAEGMVADVIAVEGDPTEDLAALHNVRMVIHRGNVVRSIYPVISGRSEVA